MFVLVIGYSKSGKSKYAEQLAGRMAQGRMLYVATMVPVGDGEAGTACITRHRAQREGLGFVTIEQDRHIDKIETGKKDIILLEDVSNLLANTLFAAGDAGDTDAAYNEILALRDKCGHLIAVSFYGLEQSGEYDGPTNAYIRALAQLNEELWAAADRVVMMEQGAPHPRKGELP